MNRVLEFLDKQPDLMKELLEEVNGLKERMANMERRQDRTEEKVEQHGLAIEGER